MTRIFLDLDGVMADLEGDYLNRFGHRMDDAPSKNKMWASINSIHDYFYELPPMQGAIEFFNKIRNHDLFILTSCPSTRYAEVAEQKKRWVRRHLCPDIMVIPCMGSETKCNFVQHPGDILIDDYGKNCREWQAAGGVAIKHEGSRFDATYDTLNEELRRRAGGRTASFSREYAQHFFRGASTA